MALGKSAHPYTKSFLNSFTRHSRRYGVPGAYHLRGKSGGPLQTMDTTKGQATGTQTFGTRSFNVTRDPLFVGSLKGGIGRVPWRLPGPAVINARTSATNSSSTPYSTTPTTTMARIANPIFNFALVILVLAFSAADAKSEGGSNEKRAVDCLGSNRRTWRCFAVWLKVVICVFSFLTGIPKCFTHHFHLADLSRQY